MDLWISLTIAAAAVQSVRTSLQKHLTEDLTVLGATFSRFLFGLPMILVGLAGLLSLTGTSLPSPNGTFVAYAWGGGFTQLTVGTTYTKTEVIQTVAVSYLVLDDRVETSGLLGILIAFAGVVLMATARSGLSIASFVSTLRHKPALFGLVVGGLYAVAAVFYRAAALSLSDGDFILRALTTLAWVTTAQAVALAFWLRFRSPGVISRVTKSWTYGLGVGFTGIVASACWYTAFTLQNASYVMAVGQVELIFVYIASRFVFKERMVLWEVLGVLITALGILVVMLSG